MNSNFKFFIENILQKDIKQFLALSGGDISQAFKIETDSDNYFLKSHQSPQALHMFQAEKLGLESIDKTNIIATPKIIACDQFEHRSFLLMEFIETKAPTSKDLSSLGKQLAALHQRTSKSFGLDSDNFIGSLPQSNQEHHNWKDFYLQERLLPQLRLAKNKGVLTNSDCPPENQMSITLEPLLKDVTPSLLHGDLWSGNFLISENGTPYLIDPAIYYGDKEVDIAMTKLFGGFGEHFYEAYYESDAASSKSELKIEIYQLYYLLVHLNLFGRSYHGSVVSILKKYF
ncbi:fructosamine kinase family protein [Mangrovimonas sp. ST2L15]|uniref:fructosamine kinase family protein n=1 Tax=Mangrovimonas sp. ST2L15 TaxID=1645916 RepID=UPI0006B68764|nr:fructosamine kinase family protein [Mangrovimonas sp. ST2L15]